MSTPDTKTIRVEGGQDIFGGMGAPGSGKPKRGSSRKQKKSGGGEPNITKVPVAPSVPAPASIPAPAQAPTPAPTPAPAPTQSLLSTQTAGNPQLKPKVKVILNKPRMSHRAVKLVPKKNLPPQQTVTPSPNKTKKARKITLGVPSLKRRITIAQKIRSKITSTPIEKLREELVSKGLLKAGSKTPDDLVRQIAADAQILSKKGL